MSMGSESGDRRELPSKLQVRYGEEGGDSPLLIFHPLAACLLAGVAAGLLAFAFGEMTWDVFRPADVARQFQGVTSNLPTAESRDVAMIKNAALADAGLGALLGLFLGLAGGMMRGDVRRGVVGGAVGLLVGGLAGGLLPLVAMPPIYRIQERNGIDPLLVGTAAQALVAGLIAATAGAAFGVAFGGVKTAPRFALFALGGGVLGAVLYAMAGAAFFPLAETDRALASERGARFLAHLLVATGGGAMVGLGLTGRRRRSRRWPWEPAREFDDADPAGAPDAPAAPDATPGAS